MHQLAQISKKELIKEQQQQKKNQQQHKNILFSRTQKQEQRTGSRQSLNKSQPRAESIMSHISMPQESVKYQSLVRGNEERRLNEKQKAMEQGVLHQQSGICSERDCSRLQYKQGQCKHHFAQRVKKAFRFHFKEMYRGPEQAFNNLDFTGKGYVLESDIFGSPIMLRVKVSRQDAEICFTMLNLFNNVSQVSALKDGVPPNGMSFDKFREIFFPQLHILDEENQSDEDRSAKEMGRQYSQNKQRQSEILHERIKALDKKIQTKIAENNRQVRKAFLALDKDFDGFVTVEDFLNYLGTDGSIEYEDLMKLLKSKDRSGVGRIDFTDFSKWFGSAIHKSEGFYFRHDSKTQNPPFNLNAQRFNMKYPEKDLNQCKQAYNENLIEKVVMKIYEQWKTMRKAFIELDHSKQGVIIADDLKFYLTHWGIVVTPDKFNELFNFFDEDKDGVISYKDFQKTVGEQMQPNQGKYWRQDMPRQTRIKACKNDHCWHGAQDFSVFCKIHLKMMQSKAFILMQDLKTRLKSRWNDFIGMLRSKADPDDPDQVFVDDFMASLLFVGIRLNPNQIETLTTSFPGRKEGTRERIRVGRFYDIQVAIEKNKTYKNLKVKPNIDVVNDASGYTGQMNRRKPAKDLVPLQESELVAIFLINSKIAELTRLCREINPDKNGVVTVVELDDILRLLYPEELEGRDLTEIYEPFCQIQNKILINYKDFRDTLIKKLRAIEVNFQMPQSGLTSQVMSPGVNGQTTPLKQDAEQEENDKSSQKSRSHSRAKSSKGLRESITINLQKPEPSAAQGIHVASQGIVTVKELLDKKENERKEMAMQRNQKSATELAYSKKRAISNFRNEIRRDEQNEVFSPYIDIQGRESNLVPRMRGEIVANEKSRPASSLQQGNKHNTLLQNVLLSQRLFENKNAALSKQERRHSLFTVLNEKAQTLNDFEKSLLVRNNHALGRNGQSQTFNIVSVDNHEKGGTTMAKIEIPMAKIEENKPFLSQSRVTTANSKGHQKRNLFSEDYDSSIKPNRRGVMQRTFLSATPSITSATGLQNSSRVNDIGQLRKDNIKAKVAYEWKQIFKNLSRLDPQQTGTVTKSHFQAACSQAGVNLANTEVKTVQSLFGSAEDKNMIDFVRMSKELSLHYSSLNYVTQQVKNVESLKQIISQNGRSDLKHLNVNELKHLIQAYQAKLQGAEKPADTALTSLKQSFNRSGSVTLKSLHNHRRTMALPSQQSSIDCTIEDKKVSLSSKLLDRRVKEESEKRQRIANILNKRREEFLDLVKSFMGSYGNKDGQLIDAKDFKQILEAFGIKLNPYEFKKLIVKNTETAPVSQAKGKAIQQGSTSLGKFTTRPTTHNSTFGTNQIKSGEETLGGNDGASNRKTKIDDDQSSSVQVRIVNGYPRMTNGPQSVSSSVKNQMEQRMSHSMGNRNLSIPYTVVPVTAIGSVRNFTTPEAQKFSTLNLEVKTPGGVKSGINVNEFLRMYS